jgi:hypothetical protein
MLSYYFFVSAFFREVGFVFHGGSFFTVRPGESVFKTRLQVLRAGSFQTHGCIIALRSGKCNSIVARYLKTL